MAPLLGVEPGHTGSAWLATLCPTARIQRLILGQLDWTLSESEELPSRVAVDEAGALAWGNGRHSWEVHQTVPSLHVDVLGLYRTDFMRNSSMAPE